MVDELIDILLYRFRILSLIVQYFLQCSLRYIFKGTHYTCSNNIIEKNTIYLFFLKHDIDDKSIFYLSCLTITKISMRLYLTKYN